MPFLQLPRTLDPSRLLRAVGLAAILLLVLSVVYRRAPISFLRAESGLYLCISQSTEEAQHRFQREFVTWSYRGHWTPLAYLSEFWTTKLIGSRGMAWHYRQLLLLTGVGVASFALVARMSQSLGIRPGLQRAMAIAVCAMLLLQPLMFEFVVWPFMGLQLLWMIFALIALLSCVHLANHPERASWIWIAAGAAYASLHMLGLGVAVTTSTAAVFGFLIAVSYHRSGMFRSVRRHLYFATTLLILLTCAHCLAMVFLMPQKNTTPPPRLTLGVAKLGLEFVFRYVFAGMQSFSLVLHPVPNNYALERGDDWIQSPNHWPFGLLGCLGSAGVIFYLCRRAFLRPSVVQISRATVVLFCVIGVMVSIVLMGGRQILSEREPYGMLPYYIAVPRYIIPLQLFLLGPLVLAVSLVRSAERIFAFGCFVYALGALVIQIQFQRSPAALLTPQTRVSHRAAWRELVEAAQECRTARIPLPNFPLGSLTEEWTGTEVKMFVPLLQRDLGMRPTEELNLISVADYRAEGTHAWDTTPSVQKFERLLERSQTGK